MGFDLIHAAARKAPRRALEERESPEITERQRQLFRRDPRLGPARDLGTISADGAACRLTLGCMLTCVFLRTRRKREESDHVLDHG